MDDKEQEMLPHDRIRVARIKAQIAWELHMQYCKEEIKLIVEEDARVRALTKQIGGK